MSINLLLAAKKRDLSALYPVNRFNDSSHPAVYQCVHSSCCDQGKYPPSKRYCSVNITESKAMEDSFADGEEFTAEDLEEIDIIASQAYTQDPGTPNSRTNHVQSNVMLNNRQTFLQPQRPAPPKRGRDTLSATNPVFIDSCSDDDNSATDVLRAQHEDLKQKLKVLQDEIILRNGEIKVLRDVLRQTESSLEQQRIAHAVLEKEKTQMQCEKNKETLKKIQSLQSELEFKDAEMIELKTKLQSCEQRTVLTQISPKKSCSVTVKLESCPSPQPGKLSFPTKESFRANTSFKAHVPVSPLHMHLSVKSDTEALNATVKQATVFSTSYCKQSMNRQGSVLLSTLMQQSEPLGTPGLYHLLSSNLGGLPVSSIQRDQSNKFQGLLNSPVLLQCLSPDASPSVVLKTVHLLALLADDEKLASLLCSCSENCLLLALYTYIISRPDKQASEKLWLQLEHEVVRFLNKLITYGWSSPSVSSEATCLCNREVVKALVLALHHEWLSVRRLTILLPTPNHNKSVLFLKEAVMVLHSLYQKDKSFSEHCLEVFHQYDQAVPGVRALFRKFNTLNENEEFALDELCPPEVETEHENMDCT
ncbi:ATR-interacting protein isoform X3 [Eleutherodactylus coqui]|uniref:ATR-interacting protein isoform X3 n=1 Tax=Eleutherodactylus coqui TaxID=57060 RepID=UPI003461CE65